MGLITNIQSYLRNRYLKSHQPKLRERKQMNFPNARSIGVLFDATDLDRRNEVLAYVKDLRQREKKVTLLGYFNNKQEKTANFTFNYFTRSDVDWAKRPKNKDIAFFLQSPYDIFIHLNPQPSEVTEIIAALTEAHLKVGPADGWLDSYDLMVDARDKSTLKGFIQQIEQLFKKTNVNHEAANL